MPAEIFMQDDKLALSVGGMRLLFDAETGDWLSMDKRGAPSLSGTGGLSSLVLCVGGVTSVTQGRNHLSSIQDAHTVGNFRLEDIRVSGDMLTLVRTAEGFTVEEVFAWNIHKQRLERAFTVRWTGEGEPPLMRWALMRMPALYRSDGMLEAPGCPEIAHIPLERLPMGALPYLEDRPDRDAPVWRPGVLAASYGNQTVIMWAFHERIPALPCLNRCDWGVVFSQKLLCGTRMEKNRPLDVGVQYVRDSDVGAQAALEGHRVFLRERGVEPLPASPLWVRDARIYEVVLGVKPSRGGHYAPYPDIGALKSDLPRIRGLGFNAVQIMPRFPYPAYTLHDMHDIAAQYAPTDAMRACVDSAHALNLRVILDVPLHGVTDRRVLPHARYDEHPLLRDHPEYFLKTERGGVARTYAYAFDMRGDALRDYIAEAFLRYTSELDVDGFRLDAPTFNCFPNWDESLSYPGYESMTGAVALFDRIRRLVWELKPGVAFITETSGPLFSRCCDMFYNYDEQWIYQALLPVVAKRDYYDLRMEGAPRTDARTVSEWLDMARRVVPDAYVKLRFADSHDTHEWGGHGMFRAEMFGFQGVRLLLAFCCFAGGAVLSFAGAERGSEDFFRDTLTLRSRVPALSGGVDFTAIRASSRDVMAILRARGDSIAIAVLHCGTRRADVTLDLSPVLQGSVGVCVLTEQYSGRVLERTCEGLRAFEVALTPYGVQLWVVELPKG